MTLRLAAQLQHRRNPAPNQACDLESGAEAGAVGARLAEVSTLFANVSPLLTLRTVHMECKRP